MSLKEEILLNHKGNFVQGVELVNKFLVGQKVVCEDEYRGGLSENPLCANLYSELYCGAYPDIGNSNARAQHLRGIMAMLLFILNDPLNTPERWYGETEEFFKELSNYINNRKVYEGKCLTE